MYDSRLIGVWRSDGRRTREELAARRDIAPKARRFLGRLMGKLQLRFTRNRCYATLKGRTDVSVYRVLAKDSSSVAIVTASQLPGVSGRRGVDVRISHLHFEEGRYWVHVGNGKFREFFKRVGRTTSRR